MSDLVYAVAKKLLLTPSFFVLSIFLKKKCFERNKKKRSTHVSGKKLVEWHEWFKVVYSSMSLTKVGNKCGEDDDDHDQGHLEKDLADPEEQAHVLGLLP